MADVSGGDSSSSSVPWQDEADPELRFLVIKQLEATMAGLCRTLQKDRSPPECLRQCIAIFEETAFKTAKDMMDYMKKISTRISFGQKKVLLKAAAAAAAERQQKMQMMYQMQLDNMVQAIQGVNNFPLTTTPQAVPMMASSSWPPFQSPNQNTACSVAINMNSNVNQGPPDMMAMLYQNFNSEPATIAPLAPGVQSSQQIMQSMAMHSENQFPAMQLQPTNIAQCHPASMVQLQGQRIAQPNGHQAHLLGQNVWDCVQHLPPTVQQEHFRITQQQMGMHMQRYQILGANVGNMDSGYSGGWNNQHNAGWASGTQSPSKVRGQTNINSHPISPSQNQIIVNKQSNLHCPLLPHESISQTRQNFVTAIPGQKTHSNQSQEVTSPCFSYKSPGALQSSLNSNDVELCCTPSPISKFWIASPNELLKSTPQSPIDEEGVVAPGSPRVSVKSTLTLLMPGFEDAASPSTLVKPASPSAMVKSGIVPAALPSDSDSSFLLHNNAAVKDCKQATQTKLSTPTPQADDQAKNQQNGGAETPVSKMPAPPADQAEDQEHGGAETPVAKTPAPLADQAEDQKHGGAKTPVAKTPAPSADQAKDQDHGGAETPVAMKPVDRLVAAVRSSSPAAICSSYNLMKSAVIEMDSVPLPIGPNNKMKRVHTVTSTSESPTFSSTDDSTVTSEFNASDAASSRYHSGKRQKPQNAALLDEIEAVNSRLIDTLISITSEDGSDGIISSNGMTLIKLSYTAVSLAPDLKSKFGVSGNFQPLVMPTTLSILADYPRSSPVIVDDKRDARIRDRFSSISVAVDRAFRLALRNLQEPRSLEEIAKVWDSCVRREVREFVNQLGGGYSTQVPACTCQGCPMCVAKLF